MVRILDVEALGIPPLKLPDWLVGQAGEMPSAASVQPGAQSDGCNRCAVYRPTPQLDGNLQVDPEIHLPSPGMDVDIAYYYNASDPTNGAFGYGRTLSHNLLAQASGSPTIVTFTRGNGARVSYQYNSVSSQYVPMTPGVLNSLAQDTTDNLW